MTALRSPELPRPFPGGMLRRFRADDLAAFQAYRRIPELGRYQGWSPMTDPAAAEFLAAMAVAAIPTPGEWVQLAIAERSGTRLIGDIGIFLAEDGSLAEIGFTLAPGAQGRGIANGAVREAVDLVFAATEVAQVLAVTDSRNEPSIRLLERVGFRRIESRQTVFREEPCIEHVYAASRSDARSSRDGGG